MFCCTVLVSTRDLKMAGGLFRSLQLLQLLYLRWFAVLIVIGLSLGVLSIEVCSGPRN